MATFESNKSYDDIQQAELLPDDWYVVKIVKQPKLVPNNKKKAGVSEEDGARDNIVINMRVVHENPLWNGRAFTKWLPHPNTSDGDRPDYLQTGMTMEDSLLDTQRKWAKAFGGEGAVDGNKISFEPGSEAMIYIEQSFDGREGREEELINNIPLDMIPRPV